MKLNISGPELVSFFEESVVEWEIAKFSLLNLMGLFPVYVLLHWEFPVNEVNHL